MINDRLHHSFRFRLAFRFGGNLQKAVAFLGVRRHGRVEHGVHLFGKDVVYSALPDAEDANRMRNDLFIRERTKIRNSIGPEHWDTFHRRPGHHDYGLPVCLECAARSRTPPVVKNRAAFRKHCLQEIIGCKAAVVADVVIQPVIFLLITHQLQSERFSQNLFGQIIAGCTQSAGSDDDVSALFCNFYTGTQTFRIVSDNGVVLDIDPYL